MEIRDKGEVWFWQQLVSPHMAGLAAAMAARGWRVKYVAQFHLSDERERQGWELPDLGDVQLLIAPTKCEVQRHALNAPKEALHICEGVRGNGLVGRALRTLTRRDARVWVAMETVDIAGFKGRVKNFYYRILFRLLEGRLDGFLAIGCKTSGWLLDRGLAPELIHPFAYFIPEGPSFRSENVQADEAFRVAFVGRMIGLKRLDLLVSALHCLRDPRVVLVVVGGGPLEQRLRVMATELLEERVVWRGALPMSEARQAMAQVDCLVLPSRYDGWGAVVSEALIMGTPVICSDGCGASVVVAASGRGGVFESGSLASLTAQLRAVVDKGPVTPMERRELARWSRCLGAAAGAEYLERILEASNDMRPSAHGAPWDFNENIDPDGADVSGASNGSE